MTKLSLNKAAAYAGVAKKTILDRLNSDDAHKKLSGLKNEKGRWEIDTSELDRVFSKTANLPVAETTNPPPVSASETSALEREVELLRERIEELGKERDQWQQQASIGLRAVEDMRVQRDEIRQETVQLHADAARFQTIIEERAKPRPLSWRERVRGRTEASEV